MPDFPDLHNLHDLHDFPDCITARLPQSDTKNHYLYPSSSKFFHMLSENKHRIILPEGFKKYFWDVAFEELSWEKNQRFIVERLLNYGKQEEIKWLITAAGKKYIKTVVKNSRNLNVKTKNYWNVMLTPVSRK